MKTKNLKPIINVLAKVANTKAILPKWGMIQFRKGRISAQNEGVTVYYHGDPMGDAAIDVGMLKKIITNFDEFNIDSPSEGHSGTAKFKFPTGEDFNHVNLEFDDYMVVVLCGITDHLKSALKYVKDDPFRPAFNSICINKGHIVATDAHKMYFKNVGIDERVNLLIHSDVAELMVLIGGDWLVQWQDKIGGMVKLKSGAWEITYTQVGKKYPEWQSVVPEKMGIKVKVNRTELIDIVKKAMLFTNQTTQQIELKVNGTLDIVAKDIDMDSSFCDSVKGYEKDGGDIVIGLNAKQLLPILQDEAGDFIKIEMDAPNRAIVINRQVLLVPVLLNV